MNRGKPSLFSGSASNPCLVLPAALGADQSCGGNYSGALPREGPVLSLMLLQQWQNVPENIRFALRRTGILPAGYIPANRADPGHSAIPSAIRAKHVGSHSFSPEPRLARSEFLQRTSKPTNQHGKTRLFPPLLPPLVPTVEASTDVISVSPPIVHLKRQCDQLGWQFPVQYPNQSGKHITPLAPCRSALGADHV